MHMCAQLAAGKTAGGLGQLRGAVCTSGCSEGADMPRRTSNGRSELLARTGVEPLITANTPSPPQTITTTNSVGVAKQPGFCLFI